MSARAVGAALGLLIASPSWAVYQCGDQVDSCQCGANNPYPCCDNGGNCTWWAWEAACCKWGVALPSWGNANQWVGNAGANASYSVLGYPVTDAVSCRTAGAYGHVAFVTSVSGASISVTEENCWGNYGMRAANYSSSFFQGYITRQGQTECRPGDTQTQACGTCGSQARGCSTNGRWAGWGACGGQGPCVPGAHESEACGQCGAHERVCTGSCQWGAFAQACEGPDPAAGAAACDTGKLGACAAGVMRCVGGALQCEALTAASVEKCDSIDNDCNGLVDDALECRPHRVVAVPAPVRGDRIARAPAEASGSCSTTGGGSALVAAALAVWMGLRRPRGVRAESRSRSWR